MVSRTDEPTHGSMTMSDLARLAGVSESTVSRALANNTLIALGTRQRIQAIARETGFAVNPIASGLRTRRSTFVWVLINLMHERAQHVSDPFMMAMLAHVADALSEAGYDMLLSKVGEHRDGLIEQMFQTRRPAGALLIGQSLEHAAIERAARSGLKLVVWGARLKEQGYATVGTDNLAGGRLAAAHLLGAGRRRIVFLGKPELPELALRLKGYAAAHKAAGVTPDPRLLVPCAFEPAAAFAAASRLAESGLAFDGIVAGSDVIAMMAMRALHAAGRRVPKDVAVVGFDDVEMAAYTSPPLTTIRQDLAKGARLLVQQLTASLDGKKIVSVVLPATLVVRESAL